MKLNSITSTVDFSPWYPSRMGAKEQISLFVWRPLTFFFTYIFKSSLQIWKWKKTRKCDSNSKVNIFFADIFLFHLRQQTHSVQVPPFSSMGLDSSFCLLHQDFLHGRQFVGSRCIVLLGNKLLRRAEFFPLVLCQRNHILLIVWILLHGNLLVDKDEFRVGLSIWIRITNREPSIF